VPFTAGRDGAWESDDTTPVFVISVAAELSGLHAQTLRQYDRLGLVSPGRTSGGGRRYSRHDIAVLREVVRLSGLGLGLEGVRQVLELENHVAALQARVHELEAELDSFRDRDRRTALVVWRPTATPQPRRGS
jgi:MerR family transcriptional regulator/heat shock protein HspR